MKAKPKPKVAFLLVLNQEHHDPEAQAITTSRKVAKSWEAKRPCTYDAEFWNSYQELPVVSGIKEIQNEDESEESED